MSRDKLEDILSALEDEGWRRLDEERYSDASRDPYVLEENEIIWGIARGSQTVGLRFQAFDDFGEYTYDLNDIGYCGIVGTEKRLFFGKKRGAEWRSEVERFVQSLDGKKSKANSAPPGAL